MGSDIRLIKKISDQLHKALGLFNLGGWIGHNGSLPGYQTVAVYLPAAQTTLVILINTDIPFEGKDPGTLLATAITTELTPEHVYRIE